MVSKGVPVWSSKNVNFSTKYGKCKLFVYIERPQEMTVENAKASEDEKGYTLFLL